MAQLLQPPTRTPARPAQSTTSAAATPTTVTFGKIEKNIQGHRFVFFGTGGIGKSTLACSMPGPVAFFDLDESLGKIQNGLEERNLLENVVPVTGITTWQGIRDALHAPGWEGVKSIVIDTGNVAEGLALLWMYENVKYNGATVTRLEDYGYKCGWRHLFDTFTLLLSDLDVHVRAGRHVMLICNETTVKVANPEGTDWIRYEPRLAQDDKSCQLRLRVKEWADHVLYIHYDINVGKDGKAVGSGSRTVYASERPLCMAKSRTAQGDFPVTEGQDFWANFIK